mgnify:CR=1 FL=1
MIPAPDPTLRGLVRDALTALGVRRFACAIFDRSFPADADEDTGAGSPGSRATERLLTHLASLGFDTLQLGPTGQTTLGNPSPYDGTVFSRGVLSLAAREVVDRGLLPPEDVAQVLAAAGGLPDAHGADANGNEGRVAYARAFRATRALASLVGDHASGAARPRRPGAERALLAALPAFRERHGAWLETDGLFATYSARYGEDPAAWPAHARRPTGEQAGLLAGPLHRYAVVQLLLHEQHEAFRRRAHGEGLRVYADLQVGLSLADRWARAALFLPGYAMGAPPSRTNPEGQPWGYPVLDPALYGAESSVSGGRGPAMQFATERIAKVLDEFDGVRVDHPHGLVCPWVYRTDDADPYHAVQTGARLFAAAGLPDHPALARYAIPPASRLDVSRPRYADDWEPDLTEEEVARYSVLMDALLAAARARGFGADDVVCEVLSTMPYPLGRVLARHGLGRFRVTQKANLDDPRDGYRAENAEPQDWIMVGNHDTEPLFSAVERWRREGRSAARAAYVAERLARTDAERRRLREVFSANPECLAQGELAMLFASPASHVSLFVFDLFGETRWFNRPGTVDPDNWTLRLPASFQQVYATRRREHRALDIPWALALALRAVGGGPAGLAPRLEALAARPLP